MIYDVTVDDAVTKASGEALVNMFFDECGEVRENVVVKSNIYKSDPYRDIIFDSFFKCDPNVLKRYELQSKDGKSILTYHLFGLSDATVEFVECINPRVICIKTVSNGATTWFGFITQQTK